MLKTGIKKEFMFFTRSFRIWGIIIAAVLFAVVSPLLMKLSLFMISVMDDMQNNDFSYSFNFSKEGVAAYQEDYRAADMSMDTFTDFDFSDMTDADYMAILGLISSQGDLTGTLMLIAMLVTMYSAGGELKKRSMIIPQNAGLTPKLYLLPKFLLYPLTMGVIGALGIWISYGTCSLVFAGTSIDIKGAAVSSLVVLVFNAFITAMYFTLGLCTSKAGLSVVIMYGGNIILTTLFSALGADKFHPFALTSQAQQALMGEETDCLNLWGSIGITLLIIVLCYFVTLFVISAKKIDNIGAEEMEL